MQGLGVLGLLKKEYRSSDITSLIANKPFVSCPPLSEEKRDLPWEGQDGYFISPFPVTVRLCASRRRISWH